MQRYAMNSQGVSRSSEISLVRLILIKQIKQGYPMGERIPWTISLKFLQINRLKFVYSSGIINYGLNN